jgi:hypothetical protein
LAFAWLSHAHASERLIYSRQIAGNAYDSLARMVVDAQGYVYATGSTASTNFAGANGGLTGTNGALDIFVLKLSPSGQIVYAKLVGGSGADYGNDLAIDSAGNVYVAGTSYSTDFPLSAGSRPGFGTNGDAVVFKLDAAGSTVLYSIGFGGAHYETPSGIAVTANGEAVVAGVTYSADFPTSAGALQTLSAVDGDGYSGDGFVVRVEASGMNVIYATYLGGTQDDGAVDVVLDSAGNAYVAGYTASAEFPVTANAAQKDLGGPEGIFSPYSSDVFLTKLGPGGGLLYSTFWGTTDSEQGAAIALDSQDRVYVGGGVGNRIAIRAVRIGGGIPFPSAPLPPTPDAFVLRVDSDGAAPAYVKWFGGTLYDRLSDLAVGPKGHAHFIANLGKSLRAELDANGSNFVEVAAASSCGFSFAAIAVGSSGDIYLGANVGDYTNGDVAIERLAPLSGAPSNSAPVSALYLSSNFGPLSSLETLNLRLDGADVDGTLQSLSVYSGSQFLGTSTNFPYNFSWTNPPAGSHTLYAVATDNLGGRGTSCPVNVTIVSPPANDSFYSSARLEGTSLTITGSTAGATTERSEPMANFQYIPSTATIWYCWTAPSDGPVAIELSGPVNLSVFTGNDLDHLTGDVGHAYYAGYPESAAATAFKATAGVTYRLVIYSYAAAAFTLTLRPANPPPNDDYANRIVLAGESVVVNASNLDATTESVLPSNIVDGSSSVWWTWTAPSDGTYRFSTDRQLSVFSTTSAYPNIIAYRGTSQDIRAVAGEQFDVRVSPVSGVPGDLQLSINRLAAPVNDRFADRVLLAGTNVTSVGSVDGATAEPFEPMHNGYSAASASVWYSWVAPSNGVARVRLNTFFASGVLAIYTGSIVSNLTSVANASSYEPDVTFPIVAGTAYQIAVDVGYGGVTNFVLSIQTGPGPVNDAFANRIALSGATVTAFGNTTGATLEPNEPQHSQWSSSGSIWYSWVAPANGRYTVVASGASPATAVYTGSDIASLSRVTPTNGFTYSPHFVQFAAVAGVQYQVAVEGYSGGPVRLQIRPATAPSNDNFADRTVVSGETLTISGSTIDATTEPAEQAPEAGTSVWFTWTVPRTSQYAFSLVPQTASLSYEVYTGTSLAELTGLAPIYSSDGVKFLNLAGGQKCQIRVFGDFSQQSLFTLDVVRADPPPNDHFADSTILDGSSIEVLGYTRAATTEVDEPSIYPPPLPPYYLPSAWWSWTAPVSGRTSVDLGSGRSLFLYIDIYTGTSVGSLTFVTNNVRFFPWQSAATFEAVAGTTYKIRVSGYFDAQFLLSLSGPPAVVQPQFGHLRKMEDGRVQIDWNAPFGRPTIVDASANMVDWFPLSTNIVDCVPFRFTDPEAHSRRFYRLRTF